MRAPPPFQAISSCVVATALVSIPNRYMHSPNEMVALSDVDATATLLAETCRAVSSQVNFAER